MSREYEGLARRVVIGQQIKVVVLRIPLNIK